MTTYRDKPPVYWTDMSDAVWQAQNTAWSPGWCATLTRNMEFLKLCLYGEGSYVGDVPHTHKGAEDAHRATTNGHNILSPSCVSGNALDNTGGRFSEWVADGFYDDDGSGYLRGGLKGDYVFQFLYFPNNNYQYAPRTVLGDGLDLTVSFFAKIREASDYGIIEFGVSGNTRGSTRVESGDDSRITVNSPGDFAAGHRGIISGADLATSWKRFYVTIPGAARPYADGGRFTIRVEESFAREVLISGFMATPGRVLYPWSPSPADIPYTSDAAVFVASHAGWANLPADVPILDWTVSMTNAVKLEPV